MRQMKKQQLPRKLIQELIYIFILSHTQIV